MAYIRPHLCKNKNSKYNENEKTISKAAKESLIKYREKKYPKIIKMSVRITEGNLEDHVEIPKILYDNATKN